jgi:hypothetical protein
VLFPLWLYSDVFGNLDSGQRKGGTMGDWEALDLHTPIEKELEVATPEWLEEELYRKPDVREEAETGPEPTTIADAIAAPLEPEDEAEVEPANREADKGFEVQGRRKDTEQAKKQRAARTRALRRTQAAERASKDVEKELAQMMRTPKAISEKGPRRTGALGVI